MLQYLDLWITYSLPYFIPEAYQSSSFSPENEGWMCCQFYALTCYGMRCILGNTPVFTESRRTLSKMWSKRCCWCLNSKYRKNWQIVDKRIPFPLILFNKPCLWVFWFSLADLWMTLTWILPSKIMKTRRWTWYEWEIRWKELTGLNMNTVWAPPVKTLVLWWVIHQVISVNEPLRDER